MLIVGLILLALGFMLGMIYWCVEATIGDRLCMWQDIAMAVVLVFGGAIALGGFICTFIAILQGA